MFHERKARAQIQNQERKAKIQLESQKSAPNALQSSKRVKFAEPKVNGDLSVIDHDLFPRIFLFSVTPLDCDTYSHVIDVHVIG